MDINDKKGLINQMNALGGFCLELGCGDHRRYPDAVGVDRLDYDNVDIQGDVYDVLGSIRNNTIAAVYSHHFFEHAADVELLVDEVARILAEGGTFKVVVPHFSNPYFYSDPGHRNFFGLYTFSYLSDDCLFSRRVPQYQKGICFVLEDVRLVFKSPRPFYVRWAFKKTFQLIFNLNVWFKELYEEFFCWAIPCYEIEYVMKKKTAGKQGIHGQ